MIHRRLPTAALVCALGLAAFPAAASSSATVAVKIHATVHMLPGGGATLLQEGTFSGAPLGRGTVRVRTKVGSGHGSTVRFVLSNARGSVRGTGDCAISFKGSTILYHGSARITGGTGAWAGIHGNRLRVSGRGGIDGSKLTVDVVGRAAL